MTLMALWFYDLEWLIPLIVMPVMCGTAVIIYVIHCIKEATVGKMKSSAPEVQQLRDTVQRLEQRLETLESVVTGAEFQAAQRVSRALEERPLPEIGTRPRDMLRQGE